MRSLRFRYVIIEVLSKRGSRFHVRSSTGGGEFLSDFSTKVLVLGVGPHHVLLQTKARGHNRLVHDERRMKPYGSSGDIKKNAKEINWVLLGEKKDFVRRHGMAKGERKKHRKENEQRERGIGNDAQSLF